MNSNNHANRIEDATKKALAENRHLKITFSRASTDLGRFLNMLRHGHLVAPPATIKRVESVYRASAWPHTSTAIVVQATELFQPEAFAEQVGHAVVNVETAG